MPDVPLSSIYRCCVRQTRMPVGIALTRVLARQRVTCETEWLVVSLRHTWAAHMTEVRKTQRASSADHVAFKIAGAKVTGRKAGVLHRAFLKLFESAFEEWSSPDDEAAFRDL